MAFFAKRYQQFLQYCVCLVWSIMNCWGAMDHLIVRYQDITVIHYLSEFCLYAEQIMSIFWHYYMLWVVCLKMLVSGIHFHLCLFLMNSVLSLVKTNAELTNYVKTHSWNSLVENFCMFANQSSCIVFKHAKVCNWINLLDSIYFPMLVKTL